MRKSLVGIAPVLLVLVPTLAACRSTSATPSQQTTAGTVLARVTSVRPTLDPYNPTLTNQGIPAEQVDFTLLGTVPPNRSVSCRISILHSGQLVGTATVSRGTAIAPNGPRPNTGPIPSGGSMGVSVEGIKGGTFTGRPSDAHVACWQS